MSTTEPDGRFYLTMECENCGESSLSLCMTTDFKDGIPVIPVDIGAHDTYECDCGAVTYTGDLTIMVETQGCQDDSDEPDEDAASELDPEGATR
jgi:hypothetical protein